MQPGFADKIQPTDAMNTADENKEVISKLQNLECHLRSRIRGQDQALTRIVSVLQRGELNLTKGMRPRGSFLFLGPTGVGKTEVTLAFTEFLMGKDRLFRFDMSEYQNQASLAVLIGGELGERGTLAMACDRSSYGTLLFDEIEKAHSRVMDLFLQILDAARVTMASGETLNLSGFYVVLTSNIASAEIVGLQHSSFATMERHVLGHAQQSMRPELYARITEKLVFSKLTYDVQLDIAQLLLAQELDFMRGNGHELMADPSVLPFLVRRGFHPRLGARPMRDAVEKSIGDAVARELLTGGDGCGKLTVDENGERLRVMR
jgi:ATP-dependent Clp protease ATP-binding subunit ClpB